MWHWRVRRLIRKRAALLRHIAEVTALLDAEHPTNAQELEVLQGRIRASLRAAFPASQLRAGAFVLFVAETYEASLRVAVSDLQKRVLALRKPICEAHPSPAIGELTLAMRKVARLRAGDELTNENERLIQESVWKAVEYLPFRNTYRKSNADFHLRPGNVRDEIDLSYDRRNAELDRYRTVALQFDELMDVLIEHAADTPQGPPVPEPSSWTWVKQQLELLWDSVWTKVVAAIAIVIGAFVLARLGGIIDVSGGMNGKKLGELTSTARAEPTLKAIPSKTASAVDPMPPPPGSAPPQLPKEEAPRQPVEKAPPPPANSAPSNRASNEKAAENPPVFDCSPAGNYYEFISPGTLKLTLLEGDTSASTEFCFKNSEDCVPHNDWPVNTNRPISLKGQKSLYVYFLKAAGELDGPATSVSCDPERPNVLSFHHVGSEQSLVFRLDKFTPQQRPARQESDRSELVLDPYRFH